MLCNNQTVRKVLVRAIFTFPTVDIGTWQRPSLGDACQSGKMATLLNSLFLVFKISVVLNYSVKYYDYILKWWCGAAGNWYVSLDIGVNFGLKHVYEELTSC